MTGSLQKNAMGVVRFIITILLSMSGLMAGFNVQAGTRADDQAVIIQGKNDPEADKLWAILHQVTEHLDERMQENSSPAHINNILMQDCETPNPNSFLVMALQAEARNKQSNPGLSVRGAYTNQTLRDNIDDSNAYLELSWEILRQGYRGNKQQADNLYRQAKIEALRGRIRRFNKTYRCRRYQLNETFVGLQASLVSLKLELMEPVYQVERRAYFKGWSYLDELLVSEQDIKLAREELKYLNSDSHWNDALMQSVNPAAVDVDMPAVIEAIRKDQQVEKLSQLLKQSLKGKNRYRSNNRLRFFLRKEFDVSGRGSRNGVAAGVKFIIPLEKKNRKSLSYRLRQVEEEAELQNWERIARTRAAYEELREQKARVIKQQYRYLRSKERVRRVFVRKGLNQDLELAAAVARVRSLFDASIELVKAKEELYRRANEIFLVARVDYNPAYIKIQPMQENNNRARIGERSIYIWAKTFNSLGNQQIFDFLEAKSIKRILLSAGKKADRAKMSEFIRQARVKNIQVEIIVGSNTWFMPEQHERASLLAITKSEITGSIHLDIEPHTVAGYKQNKQIYLDDYVSMLGKIRDGLVDSKLSVAVPTHWPAAVYAKINALVDKVYIMAYENKNTDVLVRRVKKVLANVDINKVVVVLSVKDFDDEWAMEKALNVLQRDTGIYQFGFHQLRTFLQKAGVRR